MCHLTSQCLGTSVSSWQEVIATCSCLLDAAHLKFNQLINIKHSEDRGYGTMPDGNRIPRHFEETCQSVKSHGIQLQAPDILTAAEPCLPVMLVSGILGAQLWVLLIDVQSLGSASTCLDISLKGEHVTLLHLALIFNFTCVLYLQQLQNFYRCEF